MKRFALICAVAGLAGNALAGGVEGSGLVVLDPSASGALTMTGNSSVQIPARAVYVNSNSSSAVQTSGSALLDAPNLFVCGNATFNGNSYCTGCVVQSAAPYADPLGNCSFPSELGMSALPKAKITGGSVTLQPGYYAGGIDISGNATVSLAPGVYVVGTGLKLTSGSILGAEVTIVMVSGSLDLAGSTSTQLSPPMSGPTAGMVIMQSASNTNSMSLAGGSEVNISGTMYVPKATLTLRGNSQIQGNGPQMGDLVVANRVNIAGTGTVKIGHPNYAAIILPKVPLYD